MKPILGQWKVLSLDPEMERDTAIPGRGEEVQVPGGCRERSGRATVGNVLRDLFWLGPPFGKSSRAGEGSTYIALSLWNSSPHPTRCPKRRGRDL